ncbi:MAG: hypothetical protein JSV01_05640 [Desulfobacterales bacterium]|nr:MAG: hypothetical protein JSV01_05640 [Desulfobacterales bacterium]
MEHAPMQEVEKAINGLKLCKWFEPGFGFSCEAKYVGLDCYVVCLEKDSDGCPFSVSCADSYFCISPARVYVAKELKK